ncbi:hypothetical protein MTR67_008159 [Solanum verrucosum]|uniref:RIN4 pathogenic type III effector avirulence factor Avr cleavage site domain-containing protein n=2 Tax=Solanum TaxID=4107 RepID=A0ABQ7VQ30_SOLTU|nr:hypothetical protein KY290_013825 [Solanum tuberosum]WMV14774.1 hypothetical protein MTR67_008159 [Solanum verrucosum]
MENGGDSLVPKLAGWNLNDSNNPKNNDGLYQVLKAVEAAEATIKQQNGFTNCDDESTFFFVVSNRSYVNCKWTSIIPIGSVLNVSCSYFR